MSGPARSDRAASLRLHTLTLPVGTTFRRIHAAVHGNSLGFGHSPSRFSDPRPLTPAGVRFGVVYGAATVETAVLEVVVRDRRNGIPGDLLIRKSELDDLVCATIMVETALLLADLSDGGCVINGFGTDAVKATGYREGQKLALRIHSAADQVDGLYFPSRLNEGPNLAIFDRGLTKLKVIDRQHLTGCREFWSISRKYRLAIDAS